MKSPVPCYGAVLFVLLGLACSAAFAETSQDEKACLAAALESADDSTTIGELKAQCRTPANPASLTEEQRLAEDPGLDEQPSAAEPTGVVEERLEKDKENVLEPFTIMSHRPNYLLFAAYNFDGYSADEFRLEGIDEQIHFDDTEAQFQLSIKTPLGLNLFNSNIDLYGAYTVRSFWQVYNKEESSPFRETNHEPEIWLQGYPGWELLGFKNSVFGVGFNHQSNGRNEPLSRSWNRIFATAVFEHGNLALGIKPWIRISEDEEKDNNPDITDYLGNYELHGAYKWGDNVFSLITRNYLQSGFDRGAIQAGWSFPLGSWPYLKGYVQYFNGYGESLIDYNERSNTIGIGIMLNDYL